VHRENFGVYGIEKVWRQLNREGVNIGRDRVARLMDDLDLEGVVRGKRNRITTVSAEVDARRADLVERLERRCAEREVGRRPNARQHLERLRVRGLCH